MVGDDTMTYQGDCYKQNLFVGTDPTYPAMKSVIAPLVAQHEAQTTHTLSGPSPEAVKKGKKKGERLTRSPSQDHPPWVLSFLSFLDDQNGLGGENYGQWDENELADFQDNELNKVDSELFTFLKCWKLSQNGSSG